MLITDSHLPLPYVPIVPTRLKRYYNLKHLHFLTCSCYHRRPLLNTPRRRNLFLRVLEQARRRYRFVLIGYVVMPEHIHLLISEPELGDPSVVMKVIKQRSARMLRRRRTSSAQSQLWPDGDESGFWQKRFYDFNVWTERKQKEKLRYIHRNPVTRGLVREPDQWAWSSFRSYAYGERGMVRINFQEWKLRIKSRPRQGFAGTNIPHTPLIRKKRE